MSGVYTNKRIKAVNHSESCTLPKTNIDPDNGPLEECFPSPTSGF